MIDNTGTTQGKTPYEFKLGEFVVLAEGTTSYRHGDRGGIVVDISRSRVTVNLDRMGGSRTRRFEPTDLYHINKGWYGGTYEPPE